MPDTELNTIDAIRSKRYRKLALLLEKWAAEDAPYDERTGEVLERELSDAPMRCEDGDEAAA